MMERRRSLIFIIRTRTERPGRTGRWNLWNDWHAVFNTTTALKHFRGQIYNLNDSSIYCLAYLLLASICSFYTPLYPLFGSVMLIVMLIRSHGRLFAFPIIPMSNSPFLKLRWRIGSKTGRFGFFLDSG